ncbi:MAG: ABC transporter permease [Dehalococcoidia bacterium]|nr:ABC transporter permease [Dehalococcoidia bacterium]
MDLIIEGIVQAFKLLFQGDAEVVRIMLLSLGVSLSATVISLFLGVMLGTALGLTRFPGRRFLVSIVNTGMGAPPTVVGLIVTIFLWRNGPLGLLRILYTPVAMVIAQCLISLPIITGFTLASIQQIDRKMQLQLMALGASRMQMVWLLLKESRLPLLAAVMAGFGAIISEVGASMMVGGNITGQTRVLTTAIVMETSKGEFATAIALSIILMVLVYGVNLLLTWAQQRGKTS